LAGVRSWQLCQDSDLTSNEFNGYRYGNLLRVKKLVVA
jgi:hypothetical protein